MQYQIFWTLVRIVGAMLSVSMAAGMTLGLFYFMQTLISSGEKVERWIEPIQIVDATMPEIQIELIEEIDKPEPIELVQDQQPELERDRTSLDSGPALHVKKDEIALDSELDLSMASVASTDGDYLPLVTIAPTYPERALKRRIGGWCLVKFTVSAQGEVLRDSIEVVDAEPEIIFDRSSIRAAARFRFQPRTNDGVGVEVSGVQYLFNYEGTEKEDRRRVF